MVGAVRGVMLAVGELNVPGGGYAREANCFMKLQPMQELILLALMLYT